MIWPFLTTPVISIIEPSCPLMSAIRDFDPFRRKWVPSGTVEPGDTSAFRAAVKTYPFEQPGTVMRTESFGTGFGSCAASGAMDRTARKQTNRLIVILSNLTWGRRLPVGPGRTLLGLRHGTNALEEEALYPRASVGFRGVQVALRIGHQVVHAEELARLPAAVAKRREHFERAAQQDVDLLVDAVRLVDVGLLRIAREGHVPHRSRSVGLLVDEHFLDERAVLAEHLDAIVHAIAGVHEPVCGHDDAVHRAELLRRRC